MKRRVSTLDMESALSKYMTFLTPFSFDYMKEQFQFSQKVKITDDVDDCSCEIDSSEGQLITTVTDCSCTFTKSMKLPCRYIRICYTTSQRFTRIYKRHLCREMEVASFFGISCFPS